MQNGDLALPRFFFCHVVHACVSIMLKCIKPAFVRNLYQSSYVETLNAFNLNT